MKKIKYLTILLLIGFSLSSCTMWRLSNRNMMNIRPGMTKTEIKRMLGNPEYRNFDRETEEWVYVTVDKNLIVGFYNDLVESLNTYPAGSYYSRSPYSGANNSDYSSYPNTYPPAVGPGVQSGSSSPVIRDRDFQEFLDAVNRHTFKEDKFAAIRSGVFNRAFTCKQCVRMMNMFNFDDDKLQVFNMMAANIADWENQHLILDNFKFVTSREKAKKTIDSIRIR